MDRDTYYINIGNGQIAKTDSAGDYHFQISADRNEIKQLRELFDEMHSASLGSYIRSHIPFKEYHHDEPNNTYDDRIRKVYELIYQLGDTDAKQHIDKMGILTNRNNDHL